MADDRSRRVDERLPANLVVTFQLPGRAAFIERYASNVSKGGIFIVSRELHPIGSELHFEIRSIDGTAVFSGRGIVRWTKAADKASKQLPGLGIQFTDLDDDNRAVLSKILALQADALVEGQQNLPSVESAESPTEVSAAALKAARTAAGVAWPSHVPPLARALDALTGHRLADVAFRELTEKLLAELTTAERAALSPDWPVEQTIAFRNVLATEWRLKAALAVRPEAGPPADARALDQLFAEADEALSSLNGLSAAGGQVAEACTPARAKLASLVQGLLPTTAAEPRPEPPRASGPRPAGANETPSEVKRARPSAPKPMPPKSPLEAPAPLPEAKPPLLQRVDPRLAVLGGAGALIALAVTAWLNFMPATVQRVALPELPAGLVVLGNPESGQVIVQRGDGHPIQDETFDVLRTQANEKHVTAKRLSPMQVLLTTLPR